jgi:hypothetical protein
MELFESLPPEVRPILLTMAFVAVGYVLGRMAGGLVVGMLRGLGLYTWARMPWLDQSTKAPAAVASTAVASPASPQAGGVADAGVSGPVVEEPVAGTVADAGEIASPVTAPAEAPSVEESLSREAIRQVVDDAEPTTPDRAHGTEPLDAAPDESLRHHSLELFLSGMVTLACVSGALWYSANILKWVGLRNGLERLGGYALGALGMVTFAVWMGELIIKPVVATALTGALRKRMDQSLDSGEGEWTVSQMVQTGLAALLYLMAALMAAQVAVEVGAWSGHPAAISTLWSMLALFGTLAAVWGVAWVLVQIFSSGGKDSSWGMGQYGTLGGAAIISIAFLSGQVTWVIGPALLAAAGFVAWPLRAMVLDRASGWYLKSNGVREVWHRGELLELREIRPCVTEVIDRDGKSWCLPNHLLAEAFRGGIPQNRERKAPRTPETPSAQTRSPETRGPDSDRGAPEHVAGIPLRYQGVTTPVPPPDDDPLPLASEPSNRAPDQTAPSPSLTPLRPVVEWDDAAGGYPMRTTS